VNTLCVRKWLLDLEAREGMRLTHDMLAREAGVKRSSVTHTINGIRRSEAVIRTLRFYGCPEYCLGGTGEAADE
jgi:hypothetical protein